MNEIVMERLKGKCKVCGGAVWFNSLSRQWRHRGGLPSEYDHYAVPGTEEGEGR